MFKSVVDRASRAKNVGHHTSSTVKMQALVGNAVNAQAIRATERYHKAEAMTNQIVLRATLLF